MKKLLVIIFVSPQSEIVNNENTSMRDKHKTETRSYAINTVEVVERVRKRRQLSIIKEFFRCFCFDGSLSYLVRFPLVRSLLPKELR